jgi:protein-disulfide isomerase
MIGALAMAAGAGMAMLAVNSGVVAGVPGGGANRAEIEKIVREYILNHPEILPEAMQNLERREAAKQVVKYRRDLETPFAGAWEGASDGDVVLVEFFDYACGYCRTSRTDIEKLLAEDKKLKIVYRELPILGPDSEMAARVSLAVAKSGNYKAFHSKMFAMGRPSESVIKASLSASGADDGQARTASDAQDVALEIQKNMQLHRALGFTGTPSWIVGDQVFNGAVGYDELKSAIAKARAAKRS